MLQRVDSLRAGDAVGRPDAVLDAIVMIVREHDRAVEMELGASGFDDHHEMRRWSDVQQGLRAAADAALDACLKSMDRVMRAPDASVAAVRSSR